MNGLLTSEAKILAYLANHPHATNREIAIAVSITERTVLKNIRRLASNHLIALRHVGRGTRRTIKLPQAHIDALKVLTA